MIYPALVHPGLTFLIFALAVVRATLLLTTDKISEPLRDRIALRVKDRAWAEHDALVRRVADQYDATGATPTEEQGEELKRLGREAEHRERHSYLGYFVTCPWCVSMWMALPAAIVWWNWPTEAWSLGPAVLLAFSMVTGALASKIGD